MEKRLKCLARQRKKCSDSVERTSDVCEYCGHRRCETCKPDLWPNRRRPTRRIEKLAKTASLSVTCHRQRLSLRSLKLILDYIAAARRVADRRMALAGYRLADF
jgi:hypothetical protein